MEPATMRYFDAIHALLGAIAVWQSDMGGQIAVEVSRGQMKVRGLAPSPADVKKGAIHLLERAEPYFLDGDIQQWIMDGVASFPHDIRIGDVLPPSHLGWILFERPIPHPLATTDEEQITNWWTESPNAEISLGWAALAWSTVDTWATEGEEEYPVVVLEYYHRTADGCLILASSQVWPFHEDLHTWDMAELMKVEADGSEVHGAQGFAKDVDAAAHRAAMIERAFVISLFAFMNQPFATVESRSLPRANRRSLHRETGLEDPHIKVITLRRTQHIKEQLIGGSREWACRWLVKGHWRSQYYPGAKTNKPLWIMPYVKGPQDKPLKTRNGISLFHVTR